MLRILVDEVVMVHPGGKKSKKRHLNANVFARLAVGPGIRDYSVWVYDERGTVAKVLELPGIPYPTDNMALTFAAIKAIEEWRGQRGEEHGQ